MSTYAVADPHGNFELFKKGLEKIGFSKDDTVYVLGDVIDKGPDCIGLMQYIMDTGNIEFIMGNHEHMMLNTIDHNGEDRRDGPDAERWIVRNNGILSYNKYIALPIEKRKAMIDWLLSRPLIKELDIKTKSGEVQHFVLSHSYYIPGYAGVPCKDIDYDTAFDIMWLSMFRDGTTHCDRSVFDANKDKIFITGHVGVQRVRDEYTSLDSLHMYRDGNFIDIDGGLSAQDAIVNNGMIFLRLEDMEEFILPLHEV